MAGLRLDDFLSKKKEVAQVLDLSKSIARTKEDLKKLLDKVPEFKSKPEKVRPDDVKVRDKDWNFKPTKKELRHVPEFLFANPVPVEMRPVKLDDLISVPIDWRMLTTLRPRTKLEEEYFSRLIELGKLTRQTLALERRREGPRSSYAATSSSWVKRFKSRSGVVETKAACCALCGDEFCDSSACKLFTYDCFMRGAASGEGAATRKAGAAAADGAADKKQKKRKKGVRAVKSAKVVQTQRASSKRRDASSKRRDASKSAKTRPEKRHRSSSGGRGGPAGGTSKGGGGGEGGGAGAPRGARPKPRSVSAPPAPRKGGRRQQANK